MFFSDHLDALGQTIGIPSKMRYDMLAEEPEGFLDEVARNRTELEASAENIVAHALLGFLDLSNYCLWATNVCQIMIEPEVNPSPHACKHISRDPLLWIIRFTSVGELSRANLRN